TAAARSSIDADRRGSGQVALASASRLQGKVCTIGGKGEWTAPAFPSTMREEIVVQIPPSARMRIAKMGEREFKERSDMTTKSKLYLGGAVVAVALAGSVSGLAAQQAPAVAIDNDDIGGVVTGANGPEAGVWVIAETTDLPTRYAKMVVTDDQGRYVVP